MSITLKVTRNDFPRIAGSLVPKASAVVRATAHSIEADAKGRAPVDTGALRNSIQTTMEGDLAATIAPGVDYAVFVEFGTYKMAAQPFMTPAAEAARQPFEAAMRRLVS